MQNHGQFRFTMRIRNPLMCRFANRPLWPLAVMMLRIPIVITKGHPFQAYGCIRAGFAAFRHGRYTAVYIV
jgi:hypothetical protein